MTRFKQKQHFWLLGILFFITLNAYGANTTNDRITSTTPVDSSRQSQSVSPSRVIPLSISRANALLGDGKSCNTAKMICPSSFPLTGSITLNTISQQESDSLSLAFCYTINNPVFFSFIAGSTNIEFELKSGVCAEGIQGAIVQSSNCKSFASTTSLTLPNSKSCVNVSPSSTRTLDGFGLTIGETYYLVLDNYGNVNLCDYTVNLKSGSVLGSNASIAQIAGPSAVCANVNNVKFKVSPISVAQRYQWTVDNGVAIIGSSTDTLVTMNWGTSAANVCVEIITDCESSPKICRNITIAQPAVKNLDTVLCKGQSITIGPNTYITNTTATINLPNASYTGCDSTVNLTLTILDINVNNLSKSGDLTCSTTSVTLSGSHTVTPNSAQIVYEWLNPSNNNIGATPSVSATQQGTYTLKVRATYNGKTCESTQSIAVSQSGIVPARPRLDGEVLPCANKNYAYIIFMPANDVTQYNWTIVGGTLSANTTTDPLVFASWAVAGAGKICVSAQNSCGVSESACLDATISAVPSSITPSGEQSVCPNAIKTYSVTPSANVQTYQWTVPSGASITAGQGSPTITVNWGTSTGGQVCMTPNNACGAGAQSCLNVSVTQTVPNSFAIQGSTNVCAGNITTYSVTSSPAVTNYNWIIPSGATIVSGQNTPSITVNWGSSTGGQICMTPSNTCGTGAQNCLSVVIIGIIPNTFDIQGSKSLCPGAVTTYFVTSNPSVMNYNWTVPSGATITSGQGTSSITVNWGTSTGGQVCMTPSNSCNTGSQNCITVAISTVQPNVLDIQGPSEVCPGATAKYFVANDPSVTEYKWILPSGVTALSTLNQAQIDVRFDANTNAKIILEIKNACQLSRQMFLDVVVKTVVPDLPSIIGTTTVCSNDNTNFNVANNPAITKYTWSVPTGATITSGQGSSSIQVAWGTATSGQVCLEVENACQLKNKNCLNITIKDAALQKPTIAGAVSVCPSAKVIYTVPNNARIVSYTWSTTSNAIITPSANPFEYSVEWKNTGGDICLEIKNDCGVKQSSCITVNVTSTLDSLPITGDSTICEGKTAAFTVQKDAGATAYTWSVPSGATIQNGQNTNVIVVQFGTTGGLVKVSPVGGCANGKQSSINVKVKKKPNTPLSISGKNSVCVGDIEKYSVPSQADAVLFKWTIPSGAVITQGINTREITIEWKTATSGNILVSGMGECGESLPASLAVSSKNIPTPNAGFDENICGLTYKMQATTSVNQLTWSVFQKPTTSATVVFGNPNLANTNVTVSELGNYTFVLDEINGSCKVSDTLKLSFRGKPTANLIEETCDAEATQYIVKVKLNGRAPYSFRGSLAGLISKDTFTSQPVFNGANYSFLIIDAFGCPSDTLKGQKTCACTTTAGTLKKDSLVVCFNQKGKAQHEANSVIDRDDTFEFILHKGNSKALGTTITNNKTGEFVFDASKMQYNTVYYVHYVIGTANFRGEVNQLDKCFSQSNGIPIIFKERITASLTGDTTVCAGTPASLVFKTNTNDIFKVKYQFGIESFEISQIKSLEKFDVTPSLSGTYALVKVVSSSGCEAELSQSANVTIRPRPTVNAGADQTVCDRNATLNATIPPQYKGTWKSLNTAKVASANNPNTAVENLQNGRNNFVITIQDSVCLTYRTSDTVAIFLPIIPKGNSLSLEMTAGDSIKANVTESAPVGTYSVTALDNPPSGRFALFSNGTFEYISDSTFKGIIKFRYLICSQTCAMVCDTGSVRILVKEKIKPPVKDTIAEIPNAITPNGDGKNDFFVIDDLDKFPKNELTVFNRWGDILYRSKPYNSDWNGTNQNGQALPEGTYYYVLRLNVDDGKILRGDVTILR